MWNWSNVFILNPQNLLKRAKYLYDRGFQKASGKKPSNARIVSMIITLINVLIHVPKMPFLNLGCCRARIRSTNNWLLHPYILGSVNAGVEVFLLYIRTEILLRCVCHRIWALITNISVYSEYWFARHYFAEDKTVILLLCVIHSSFHLSGYTKLIFFFF